MSSPSLSWAAMALYKELDDLWGDITGTLIEFFLREIGGGMGHS